MRFVRTFLATALLLPALAANDASAGTYGCFKVTASSLNIRARPYSDAEIIGTAYKDEILEKRKLFCTPRGFWCAIRKGKLEGYADKSNMVKIACP
jgi:hypothetical protein